MGILVGHMEVDLIGRGTVLDLAGEDIGLNSHPAVVRSLAEVGIGLNSHLVVEHNLAGADIGLVAVAGRKEPAGHKELVGHKLVGAVGPDLRNSRCLT